GARTWVGLAGTMTTLSALAHNMTAYATETHYLRVYLAQLRRKLEDDPSHPKHLVTESGMGYRFEA
ncbi:winged helix-turn-helix domain-containing protein, partial [Mycobacterium sp. E2497]|uniref:winged helix-turn-helix domain-containing protein n=1 Tax=Mycobacterium sp. E2497 TaxID=1834135 RepID=UPI001E34B8BC